MPVEGSPVIVTVPVDDEQSGWVVDPMEGATGVTGGELMVTPDEASEVQPAELVTVKLCIPVLRPVNVAFGPEPAKFPGLIIQLPAEDWLTQHFLTGQYMWVE